MEDEAGEMDLHMADGYNGEDEEDDKDEECSQPTWDDEDRVFRCKACTWEVLDGICEHCDTEYDMPEVSESLLVSIY
jgi:hypothetical protein